SFREALDQMQQRTMRIRKTVLQFEYTRSSENLIQNHPVQKHACSLDYTGWGMREIVRDAKGREGVFLYLYGKRGEIGRRWVDKKSGVLYGMLLPPNDSEVRDRGQRLNYYPFNQAILPEYTFTNLLEADYWLTNHLREAEEQGNLRISEKSENGIRIVTYSAGGISLGLAPEKNWAIMEYNKSLKCLSLQPFESDWLPLSIEWSTISFDPTSSPPTRIITENIRIEKAKERFRVEHFQMPEPEPGDWVRVMYPKYNEAWDIRRGVGLAVSPEDVENTVNLEHEFQFSKDLSLKDQLIWETSKHWREPGVVRAALREKGAQFDLAQRPMPFLAPDESKIIWASHTGTMSRVGEMWKSRTYKADVAGKSLAFTAEFEPLKDAFPIEENSTVNFAIENDGKESIYIVTGADGRGERSDRYSFWAFDEKGMPADIKWTARHFGGPQGAPPEIKPGETWGDAHELSKWITFDRPGNYTVRCRRVIHIMGKNELPTGDNIIFDTPFLADFEIEVYGR
ncbi:MAG: hypothetical protein ACLFUS_06315, partial [Candidatus Sumerlaeia bacterium]